MKLDSIDIKLLVLLQGLEKLSFASLGKELGLSVSAVSDRIKKLKNAGVIKGQTTLINPKAIGMHVCAFISIFVNGPEDEDDIVKAICEIPEVLECNNITGEYSFLLKVCTRNTDDLKKLLNKIRAFDGVEKTNTMIVLSSYKETTAISINSTLSSYS
ncbi:Lrp/AsnC family transcriptional regulator [Desulfocicer niacini]